MAIIVGLTGGIATGKSTLSQMFKKSGIPVIDSDNIARTVLEINKPAYLKVIEEFGKDITICTGHINRKKLAKLVFNDLEKLEKLNSIVHPEVKKIVLNEINKYNVLGYEIIVLDVPLLFESNFDELCNFTVVVFTDEKTQLSRLMKRDNLELEDALKRIKSQKNMGEKIRLADFIIDNSLSILETRKQYDSLLKKIK